jgi:ferredoxin/flavodoxin---NADP+ reductase
MHKIIDKKELTSTVDSITLEAPLIAKKSKAGQFVVLMIDEKGERIPLTIADSDAQAGTITLIVQKIGKTTMRLGKLEKGSYIRDVLGPLGNPADIKYYGEVVIIGGGVGAAVAYPEAKALKKAGNQIITILGARSKDLLILEEEMKKISDESYTTTDDGSKGFHGLVTDVLKKLVDEKHQINLVLAIGPTVMMRAVAEMTRPLGIKTIVSLNPIMIDGTGMCGGCRVTVGGETRFVCVDGPEFDAHLVDFNQLRYRQRMYMDEECEALKLYQES